MENKDVKRKQSIKQKKSENEKWKTKNEKKRKMKERQTYIKPIIKQINNSR